MNRTKAEDTPRLGVVNVKNGFPHVKKYTPDRGIAAALAVIHFAWLGAVLAILPGGDGAAVPYLQIIVAAVAGLAGLSLLIVRPVGLAVRVAAWTWLAAGLGALMVTGGAVSGLWILLFPGPLIALAMGRSAGGLGLGLVAIAGAAAVCALVASGFADARSVLSPGVEGMLAQLVMGLAAILVLAAAFQGWRAARVIAAGPAAGQMFIPLEAVMIEADDGGMIRFSEGRLAGRLDSSRHVIGQCLRHIAADPAEMMALIETARGGGTARRTVEAAGEQGLIDVCVTRARHGDGFSVLVLPGNEDMAARAAAAAAKAELAERTAFFAGLGHDLKTPLNAIIGFSEMMRGGMMGEISPVYRDRAGLIHESGQDLLLLVEDMLDLARSEAGQYRIETEPVNLTVIGASVARQVEAMAVRQEITLAEMGGGVWAEADPRTVRQIWQNLMSNAIKYSRPGGTVRYGSFRRGEMAVLFVSDEGIGMSEADLARIARPFAQGENSGGRQGTGLGLAVVHRMAQLQGGALKIETAEGAGTHVEVSLPRARAEDIPGARGFGKAAE